MPQDEEHRVQPVQDPHVSSSGQSSVLHVNTLNAYPATPNTSNDGRNKKICKLLKVFQQKKVQTDCRRS